jgi:hypothetical protein
VRFIAVIIALLCTCSAWAGGLGVREAYYRDTNASLHIIVANSGKEPVSVLPPVVNGFDTAAIAHGTTKGQPVIWYHCRPNPIPAGAIADLVIVLADPSTRPVEVKLRTSSGQQIARTVPCAPEQFRFQAIRFSKDLRTVDVYMRCPDAVRSIRMDGKRVSGPAQSLDGLAYARIRLPKALDKCSFHVFEAETRSGLSTGYSIRAIPSEFLIGVYGSPSPENVRDWAAHGCNHYLAFGGVSTDQLALLQAQGMSVGAKYIHEPLVDREAGKLVAFNTDDARTSLSVVADKPNLLYHHLVDEPDAADYYADHTLGACAMELAARADFYEAQDPGRYSFVQLDNTFRPMSYRVYGESADLLATHRYSLGNLIHGEAGVRTESKTPFLDDLLDTVTLLRGATEPKPFFMVSQFFDLGPGRSGRPPTVDEMRLQSYAMVAGGARGIIHYIHSGSGGGHEGGKTKALWDGMTDMHAGLMRMGDIVGMGTPAPASWAASDSPHIISSLILAGDRMGVVLINRSHRSGLEQFTARPVQNVKMTIRIPPWMKTTGFKVTSADTGEAIPVHVEAENVSFTVSEIEVASGFLIQPKD